MVPNSGLLRVVVLFTALSIINILVLCVFAYQHYLLMRGMEEIEDQLQGEILNGIHTDE